MMTYAHIKEAHEAPLAELPPPPAWWARWRRWIVLALIGACCGLLALVLWEVWP